MSLLCCIHTSLFRKTLILGDYLNYFIVIDSLGDFPEALSIYPKFSVQWIEMSMDACVKRKFSKTNRKAFELLLLHCPNQLDRKLPDSNCTRSPFPFHCPFVPSTEVRELVITSLFKEDPPCRETIEDTTYLMNITLQNFIGFKI